MPDLLLELFSEEIPAGMQRRGAEQLKKLVTDALVEHGLLYEGAKAFATPRRLALTVGGVPARSPDRHEEKKGPRVGAPEQAIAGFLRGAGLTSIDQAKVQQDKRGDFYLAHIEQPGRPAIEILAEVLPAIIRSFPWPKSMRWGERSAKPGSLTWVRPLHSIVCTFGPETETPDIVPFEVDGIAAGNRTSGHRFMAPGAFTVTRFDDYVPALEKAKVVLDADRRKDIILADIRDRALALGLELIDDEALLEEVAGLVEWPVVLIGSFAEEFLELPEEVIRATIRANQKCFVLRDGRTSRLTSRFALVANIEASDGGTAIVAGNQRVIRARLSDARFFWETDLKLPLAGRVKRLDGIVFHDKLGSQGERVRRIMLLAREIATRIGADPAKAERAAELAKADLVTDMVGEFPELQGLMGRYYATRQNEDASVATAIEDHYKPLGPSDRVPTDSVAIAVALADKLDVLVGFWAIDEKPTGSKDPYALRRAALGVIRILLENNLRLGLTDLILSHLVADILLGSAKVADAEGAAGDLLAFLADRLTVQLREQGARHDLVAAVFSLGGQEDIVLLVRRVEALGKFFDTEDGNNLLTGYRRAANILREEEKKGGSAFDGPVDPNLLVESEEKALYDAVGSAEVAASAAVATEDFAAAMAALAKLRAPVDAFFDKVLVNAEDAALRANRLRLLNRIRQATMTVADFARIGG